MPMKVVECLGCIFASELPQDNGATGMRILEVGYIVDLMIDNRPEAFVGGVLPAVRMWMSCLRTHVITLATSSLVKGAILGLARRASVIVRYERIQLPSTPLWRCRSRIAWSDASKWRDCRGCTGKRFENEVPA